MEVIISDQFKSKIKKRDILTSISQSPFASLVIKKANVAIVDGTTLDSICPPEKKKFLDPECVVRYKKQSLEQ